ncbi:hypothetical protein TNCV_2009021 [Trichonephila clavipes]|nr:hypothetical protein TNCV_2009021 [Trichonephila clavipes]
MVRVGYLKEADIYKLTEIQRLKRTVHLTRLDDNRVTKMIFVARLFGTRLRGKPRFMWIDFLEKDMKTLISEIGKVKSRT